MSFEPVVLGLFTLGFALAASAQENESSLSLPHSFARPEEVRVQHLELDLIVDFDEQQLHGSALLKVRRMVDQDEAQLFLDTNGLDIKGVTSASGVELQWELKDHVPLLGRALVIQLPQDINQIEIQYATHPTAEALQWLVPEQTTDKQYPFLFTQSQAILARTWVPCQDTPAVRMTYSARIQVPSELMAVMSASNPQTKNESGVYEFEMQQPIPSYLLALAVGDLRFQQLGPRSGVYAEPSVLQRAAWELNDTERMIGAAEELYGPYRWERYDVIFLPSSFPFGGMENPRLTFATPTILAGDRSLVALIAHELAHSWSGNLVTNATWNDFWLNEGFTVYFEQRIMEAVYGRPYAEMLATLTLENLQEEIRDLKPRDTWLKLDLAGRNPDDGMSAIAYDKGYFFLRYLEEQVGRERWDRFLRDYFDQFAFQSMTTEDFLAHLKLHLAPKVDLDAWVYAEGLPDVCPKVTAEELERVNQAIAEFAKGQSAQAIAERYETDSWTTHHWNHFLRKLSAPLNESQMQHLDDQFQFTQSGNSEITHDWLLHVIEAKYQPAMEKLATFLTEQGRRKFLAPLYRKLAETADGRQRAIQIYQQARPGYHAVSRQTIDEILDYRSD